MRLSDPFPGVFPEDLAADGACSIFDHGEIVLAGNLQNRLQVAGHADLVNAEDCSRAAADGGLDFRGIDVEGCGFYVYEDRQGSAVTDAVGGGNERMADCDYLVAGAHAYGEEGKMEGGRATGDCNCVRRTDVIGELTFKGRNLWALGDPSGKDCTASSGNFFFSEVWTCDWDEIFRHEWRL